MSALELLSLGCGWTGSFLLPLLDARGTSFAFTTTSPAPARPAASAARSPAALEPTRPPPPPLSGPPPRFDPWPYLPPSAWPHHTAFRLPADASDPGWSERVRSLPVARVVLIVFPIQSTAVLHKLIHTYEQQHPSVHPAWMMLGSPSLWKDGYSTHESPIDTSNSRGRVEDALLALQSSQRNCTVLNLAGLYGHTRQPINFLRRAVQSVGALEAKGSLHLIHGQDVARAIAASLHAKVWGKRWILTDTKTYDWWLLARTLTESHGTDEEHERYTAWARQVSDKHGVTSLPRPPIGPGTAPPPVGSKERLRILCRVLDSSAFWTTVGLEPAAAPLDAEVV